MRELRSSVEAQPKQNDTFDLGAELHLLKTLFLPLQDLPMRFFIHRFGSTWVPQPT